MNLFKKKEKKKTELEKVEERREEVLAQGRKFKYPLQYTKHRIVINTIIITIVVLILLSIGGWFALYRMQDTSDLLFRVTKIIPVPVASVDGEAVKFSDYLMIYNSSINSIEHQSGALGNDDDAVDLRARYKRAALSDAEKYSYALKLSKELGITVSEEEINTEFERHRQVGGIDRSMKSFIKILGDNFGLSESEYRRMLYLTIMKVKVESEIDTRANEIANNVATMLANNGGDYKAVADALGDAVTYEETGSLVDNKNIDGGRAALASKLNPGEQSGKFTSMNGDGYYFVKLIDKTESKVNFVSLKVSFSEFENRFNELSNSNKIGEFITLE